MWGKVMFSPVFVCLEGGWLPSMHHRSHDRGGLHLGVGQAPRVCLQRGGGADPSLRHMGYYGIGSIRGRCASCWEAFLYKYANRSVRDPIRLGMGKCTSHLSVIAQFYPSARVFTSACCALVVVLCWVVWDFLRFCLSPKF